MKTLLDVMQEYAALNDAKTLGGGVLPRADEERWAELKEFYDLLMAQEGLSDRPAGRFTADDIRQTVTTRARLRVNTDMEIVVVQKATVDRAHVGNLSCGGVLLLCDTPFGKGGSLTLHLTNIARGAGILPADSEVAWLDDQGPSDTTFRYKIGIRFLALGESERNSLDSFVVDTLENKLLSLSRDALDPEFLRREQLVL
jgi:hypothetical protein